MAQQLERRVAALESVLVGDAGFTWIIREVVSRDGSSSTPDSAEVYGERLYRKTGESEDAFLSRAKRRADEMKPERKHLPRIIINPADIAL